MKKSGLLFLTMLFAGIALRIVAMNQLNWFLGFTLHVDEITYSQGDTPPFERPPGTYLLASLSDDPRKLRTLFSAISLVPAAAFYIFRKKNIGNSVIAGVLALEPTLAFSGLQVLPSAPAAAFLALSLCSEKPVLRGWLTGCAALFRGELLIILPVSLFFVRPAGNWLKSSAGFASAVLPLMFLNFLSGGPFATGENGPLNLWLGTSWDLLSTPPGIEYEELVGGNEFTEKACEAIKASPGKWILMGFTKTAAFLSVPGPGRNLETPELLKSTIFVFLLPITGFLIALALTGWKQDYSSALLLSGILAAFIFFPSVRHRAVYLPAVVLMASRLRWKQAVPALAAVVFFSFFIRYPGGVRPGLTELQHSQNLLEQGSFTAAMEYIELAEERGYEGADLHNIRGACIASSGGEFRGAAREFSRALELAPGSPTAWKNIAVLLWNNGYREEALYAAEKAVSLNSALRTQLGPILQSLN